LTRSPCQRAALRLAGVGRPRGFGRSVASSGHDVAACERPLLLRRYRDFWVESNQFLARLYRSPLVTIAAIRGACPAGGCCLSLCCDLRIMADGPGHIGLNEVAIGISVPLYWARLMARVVGQASAERLCQFATLAGPQDAKQARGRPPRRASEDRAAGRARACACLCSPPGRERAPGRPRGSPRPAGGQMVYSV